MSRDAASALVLLFLWFYPSYKRFDCLDSFAEHESPRLEGIFDGELRFYISSRRFGICILPA